MPLTLKKLPVQSKDDEQACYLQVDGFAAKADGVPVLQHCVLVQPEHLKRWQPTVHYCEIVAKEDGTADWRWTFLHTHRFEGLDQLADGEAFVDVENFSGDYSPVYVCEGALRIDEINFVPKKNSAKGVIVYILQGETLRTFLLSVETRGFGMGDMGAARTDPESEIEYRWWGNKAFGYAVGLCLSRHQDATFPEFSTEVDSSEGKFYRCSDPGIAHAASTLPVYSTDAEAVIYKRFKTEKDNLYASDANIRDSGEKRKKKNRPYQPDGVRLVKLLARREGVPTSYKTEVAKKRKGRTYEMEGKTILREGDVGVAEGILIEKSGTKRGTMPKTPTARANELLASEQVRVFVRSRDIKLDGGNRVRTDQEWCHLLATSLRGHEEFYNFVLGSKHCNSEQLAIESALLFSLDAVRGARRALKVKISAYVVPNTSELLGEVIRYKVLMTTENGDEDRLLLDHLIDAQSESLSYLEYRVLHETVRRVIALELGEEHVKEYVDRLNRRIEERHASDKQGEGLTYAIDENLKDELFVPDETEDDATADDEMEDDVDDDDEEMGG